MKTFGLLILALFLGSNVFASPLDDQIKSFTDAVKTSEAAKNPANPMMEERMMSMLQISDMPGGDAGLEATVRQIMASDPSPEVQKTGQALLDALAARKKERLDAATTRIDAALNHATGILAKAQKPADLDGLLADLQAAQPVASDMGYGGDPDLQVQINRLNAAYQFVTQWQDYLSAEEHNPQDALTTLRNLSNFRGLAEPTLIPRSEILARIADLETQTKAAPAAYGSPAQPLPPDLAPLIDGVKTLDDLAPTVKKFPANVVTPDNNFICAQLAQFASLYAEAKNGLPLSLELSPSNIFPNTPPFALDRIKSMLLLYLLPLYFGPSAPAVNSGETVQAYLERVTAAADAAQNWPLLQHVIAVKMKLSHGESTATGVQSLLAGLGQETAGQYSLAVFSYETALRQPDVFTSASFIGDRLAALKKDHPADFDAGVKYFLTPPAPIYNNPYARYGLPGYPPVSAPIPSVTAAPTQPLTNAPSATPRTNAAPVPSGK